MAANRLLLSLKLVVQVLRLKRIDSLVRTPLLLDAIDLCLNVVQSAAVHLVDGGIRTAVRDQCFKLGCGGVRRVDGRLECCREVAHRVQGRLEQINVVARCLSDVIVSELVPVLQGNRGQHAVNIRRHRLVCQRSLDDLVSAVDVAGVRQLKKRLVLTRHLGQIISGQAKVAAKVVDSAGLIPCQLIIGNDVGEVGDRKVGQALVVLVEQLLAQSVLEHIITDAIVLGVLEACQDGR